MTDSMNEYIRKALGDIVWIAIISLWWFGGYFLIPGKYWYVVPVGITPFLVAFWVWARDEPEPRVIGYFEDYP